MNDSIAFTPFKSDIDKTIDGLVPSSHSTTITSPDALPQSITALGKYFLELDLTWMEATYGVK